MKNIVISIKAFIIFSILLGLIYPLAITGIAQVVFPQKANGSLIVKNGKVIGSKLIGQNFYEPKYFYPRPSAVNYNASASGASNLGPTSKKLMKQVEERIAKNKMQNSKNIPSDAILTSASGLDPHISIKNAKLQIPRVSKIRNIPEAEIKKLINQCTDHDFIGIWGQRGVNVLRLNIALDEIGK